MCSEVGRLAATGHTSNVYEINVCIHRCVDFLPVCCFLISGGGSSSPRQLMLPMVYGIASPFVHSLADQG
jgi:hypothetical protein